MKNIDRQSARYWIEKLQLQSHPEGGYFRQSYRSELTIPASALPPGFGGARAVSTGIYFLLEGKNFSAFHRLRSDEMWHFYAGSPLLVHVIEPSGKHGTIFLGTNPEGKQVPQAVVRAGFWFASHVWDWKSWALAGCTVAPGFDFGDFELGTRADLLASYPQHGQIIRKLTRG